MSPEEEACPELGESSTEPFEVIPEEDEVLASSSQPRARITSDSSLIDDHVHDPAQDKLHTEFPMLKYPSKPFRFPKERLFTVDKDNLVGVARERCSCEWCVGL